MRPKLSRALTLALTLLLSAVPLLAHHSVLAEYDSKKPVTLNGVITRVLWINPHTFWYLDTKDASGNYWQVEGPSPAEWRNAKVTRDLAKMVPDRALGHKFTFPDGHIIQLKMNENGETVASPAR
jgi:Family of unknown function (DUF6152)